MYEKVLVLQVSSKSRSFFNEKAWFFKQNGDFESEEGEWERGREEGGEVWGGGGGGEGRINPL